MTDEETGTDWSPERLEREVLKMEAAMDQRIIDLAAERAKRSRAESPWRSLAFHVEEIEAHKNDPWIRLQLGSQALVEIRQGAMAVLVGGPGSGKSTLAANILYEHAQNGGVSIMNSAELPGLEFVARLVGIKCDASWSEVLTGQVARSEMDRVAALDRFVVLEREWATLEHLRSCAIAQRALHPASSILVAVDYVQIMQNEVGKKVAGEERLRIADIVCALDRLARDLGLVIIALSQMSTASAKLARSGEALGNDAGELAAETSAFNRYATVALSIGKKGEASEGGDGSRVVELSIGKSRMGGGDIVIPIREWGRSGKWLVEGEAQSPAEVRQLRDAAAETKKLAVSEAILLGVLTKSDRPLSRNDLCAMIYGRRKAKFELIQGLIDQGLVCETETKSPRSHYKLLWTSVNYSKSKSGDHL